MKLPENISDAADKAKDLLDQTTATATDKAKDVLDGATDKVKGAYSDAADKAKSVYGDAADKAQELYDEAASKAADLKKEAAVKAKEASDKAVGAFKNLSTTQKVVGGALLAAGLAYLVAPKKKGKAKRKTAALDQLLLFVNDRVEGYKRAVAETKDGDLRTYYQELAGQSREFADQLNTYLTKEGGERELGTTFKGKLYRKLMDAQAVVTGRDEKAILAANIYGERWALKAYKKTLRRKALKGEIRNAVQSQFKQSKKTYKKLKELVAQQ